MPTRRRAVIYGTGGAKLAFLISRLWVRVPEALPRPFRPTHVGWSPAELEVRLVQQAVSGCGARTPLVQSPLQHELRQHARREPGARRQIGIQGPISPAKPSLANHDPSVPCVRETERFSLPAGVPARELYGLSRGCYAETSVTWTVIDAVAGRPYLTPMPTDPSDSDGLRQARLRPEAIARCPWAPADVWLPAANLAEKALREAGRGILVAEVGRRAAG